MMLLKNMVCVLFMLIKNVLNPTSKMPPPRCGRRPPGRRASRPAPWRAVRDALVAQPEPPPRRFKRPRLRGAPAAAPAARAQPVAQRARRPERAGAFDADDRAPTGRRETAAVAAPAAAPESVDDATVTARTKELLAADGEIKRQYADGTLTVKTLRIAVAAALGVDEEAIKNVVKATFLDYNPDQMQAADQRGGRFDCRVGKGETRARDERCPNWGAAREAAARNTRRRSFWAGGDAAEADTSTERPAVAPADARADARADLGRPGRALGRARSAAGDTWAASARRARTRPPG